MRAAWYENQGQARDVFKVGEMPDPHPGAGEVRIRVAASGINPGDIKKRQDAFGYGMTYPRVIPHSDGAGQVDQVGNGVSSGWLGSQYGATEPNRIARLVWRQNLRSSRWIKLFACPKGCRWTRARVLGYPVSPHTGPSMLLAPLVDGPCWFKGRRARSGCAQYG
jgi:hypothetical protein